MFFKYTTNVAYLYYILFAAVPLWFYAGNSELFEYNKMMLTYAITTLVATVWAIKSILAGKFIFKRSFLDIPLILYLVSHLLSTIFSLDPHMSFWGYYSRFHEGLLASFSYALLYWAAVSNLNRNHVSKSLLVSLVSASFVSVYGILEHFGHSFSCWFITGNFDVACWVQDVQGRVFATLGQPNWLAAYLDVLILLSLGFVKKSKKILILTALFLLALWFTKSRSGLVGLGIGLAVFTIFSLHISQKIKLFICAVGLVLSSALGFWLFQNISTSGAGAYESGAIRRPVWEGAIKVWQRYPVFGSGVETFAISYYKDRPASHNLLSEWDFLYNKAHNEFLNLLATTGTLGMVAYLTLIAVSLKRLRNNPAYLGAYISILVTNFFGFSVVIIGLFFFLLPAFNEILSD